MCHRRYTSLSKRDTFKTLVILTIGAWINDPATTVGEKKVITGCNFDMLVDQIMEAYDEHWPIVDE